MQPTKPTPAEMRGFSTTGRVLAFGIGKEKDSVMIEAEEHGSGVLVRIHVPFEHLRHFNGEIAAATLRDDPGPLAVPPVKPA